MVLVVAELQVFFPGVCGQGMESFLVELNVYQGTSLELEQPGLQWQCPHPGPALITCSEKRGLVVWSSKKSLLHSTKG